MKDTCVCVDPVNINRSSLTDKSSYILHGRPADTPIHVKLGDISEGHSVSYSFHSLVAFVKTIVYSEDNSLSKGWTAPWK